MRKAIAALATSCGLVYGCRGDDPEESGEGCGYEEREVSLDARFGGETPREVVALLERPVTGIVTWTGAESEYLEIASPSGTSTFSAQADVGPVIHVREGVEDKGGIHEDRVSCPTELIFDMSIRFESEDGAIAEDWSGQGTYIVSGTLGGSGTVGVVVADPRPFAGTLEVTERPEVAQEWDVHALDVHLIFATYPLDFTGLNGTMRYVFQNDTNGGIDGRMTTIAEFSWPR